MQRTAGQHLEREYGRDGSEVVDMADKPLRIQRRVCEDQWWMARLGGSEGATGGDEVSCQPDNAITGSSKQTSKANGFDEKASLFPDVIGEVRLFTGPS